MKTFNIFKIAVISTALVFLTNSCGKSFLEYKPQGSLNEQTLATLPGLTGLLIGAYGALDGTYTVGWGSWSTSQDNWIYGSIASPDAHKGSDASDQPPMNAITNWSIDPSNGFMSDIWRAMYEGIARCNSVLKVAGATKDVPADQIKLLVGEAKFLRGVYYFELKKMFNMVPWIDETTTDYKQPNDKDIWPNMEADFKFAMDNLGNTAPSAGRANKWAAAAYLAKAYLYQKKYNEARTLFTDVIDNGTTSQGAKYDLLPEFEDNFRPEKENGPESVFAIQMSANDQSPEIANANFAWMLNFPYGGPFGCCGFFQPSFDLVNSDRVDDNGLPLLDTYNAADVKSDFGITSESPYSPDETNPIDPRVDWTAGRRGIPYLDWQLYPGMSWVRDQAYSGPYAPKKNVFWKKTSDKYWDKRSWAPGSAINVLLIRFSDVLLLAAESEAQAGSLEKARQYVNRVRTRAANPAGFVYKFIDNAKPELGFSATPAANYKVNNYPASYFTSKAAALKAIYFERKLELAMEGHRFFDLSRWGEANTQINGYYAFEGKKTPDIRQGKWTQGKNEFYPIPLDQIDVSKVNGTATLKQNPGY